LSIVLLVFGGSSEPITINNKYRGICISSIIDLDVRT